MCNPILETQSFVLFIVGHGRSEGEPVQISSFDIYAADVLKHMDEKLVNHGGLPIFLFGHSMASFHPPLFNWKSSLEVIRWRRKEMGNFLVIEEVFSKNIIFSGHEKKYIGLYQPKWIVLLLHADWLVGKWIASNIHLQATNEAKLCIKSLISNHFLVHWKK